MRQKFGVNVAFTLYTNCELNLKFGMALWSRMFAALNPLKAFCFNMFNVKSLPRWSQKRWEVKIWMTDYTLPNSCSLEQEINELTKGSLSEAVYELKFGSSSVSVSVVFPRIKFLHPNSF